MDFLNNQYNPRPSHVLFPLALFALGALCMFSDRWDTFGAWCWFVAFVTFAWIVYSGVVADRRRYWDTIAEVLEASAKNDYDRIAKLGFNPDHIPQQVNITISKKDKNAQTEAVKNIYDLPVTLEKLRKLSDILVNENAPFSRREYVDRRGLFKDWEWRKFQDKCEREKLVIPKTSGNGFELTDDGKDFFIQLTRLPSPPPPMG